MVIGSLWIRAAHCTQVSDEIERLKQQAGERHEIKWNATTKKTLPMYGQIVELTCGLRGVRYRAIIVDQHILNHRLYNEGDPEMGFYKFYFQLLYQEITCRYQHFMLEERYLIHPDERSDRQGERVQALRDCLNQSCRTRLEMRYDPVSSIDPFSSREHALMQMTDLWTGAIAASKNRSITATVKQSLLRLMEAKWGRPPQSLHLPSRAGKKAWFNVWMWKPSALSRTRERPAQGTK